eukprot:Skav224758  [mRNA]  locus=scaffold1604:108777:109279:+ [translate_table: standard]
MPAIVSGSAGLEGGPEPQSPGTVTVGTVADPGVQPWDFWRPGTTCGRDGLRPELFFEATVEDSQGELSS